MGIEWEVLRESDARFVQFVAFHPLPLGIVFDDLRAAKNFSAIPQVKRSFNRKTMGKKSKKGVVRSGAKPRAAAGKGKRSGSVSEDGRSLTSQDAHKSNDSAPIGVKPVPGNVTYSLPQQPTANGGDQNNKDSSVYASIPITTAPVPAVKAPAPAVKAPATAVKAPKAKAATDENGVWSGNLRDAVKADAEGPAVLDVTMDEDALAEPKVSDLAASVAEPVVQSRGGFSLTEPAPKEAKSEKQECHCAIL
jgi:hypothetical protein